MERVSAWEDHRKQNYDKKWDEYYRLWRGIWKAEDKNRDSERSRLISPALSQAIESSVAELEEATFGSGKWFDATDDSVDDNPADIAMWRDQLAEDFTKEEVEACMSEVFLNGAIYGTGIGKMILKEVVDKKISPTAIGDTEITKVGVESTNTIRIGVQAVHPKEFVIDPSARSVDDALGMAHITEVPKHTVQAKQASGVYFDVPLTGYSDTIVGSMNYETDGGELKDLREQDKTMIVEYHGFVPRDLLESVESEDEEGAEEAEEIVVDETDLIEAIVTIANGTTLLRAVENPYIMGDRCFMAYQHDTVPNMFWGRGVAEKGYNPQKALDAESRGRIDAMTLSIHPMMAMDATRLHRGADLRIAPGRNILTNGDPKSILMPFSFGQVNPTTFTQTADLERQVQMGTGSMDSAIPIGDNRRNETSGGMSMIQGGSIKRSKRTLANIERKFIRPMVHKAAWRYMQFAPERYPVQDIKFNVHSTLGIVARELEQQQLASMMNTVPAESPAFWMLLKGVFEHSNLSNREEMLEVITFMMQQSLQKQAQPEPDPLIAIKMKEIEVDAQLDQAKLAQKADADNKQVQIEIQKLQLEAEALKLKKQQIILDAQIALAAQEQDSLVTEMQMNSKNNNDQFNQILKLQEKLEKQAEKEQSRAPAPVININGEKATLQAEKPKKKKITITRTADGLSGTTEDVD
jgi:hypothetical protein